MLFTVGLGGALSGVHENWTNTYGQFAHGYLVLLMAAWLAWQRRDQLRAQQIRPWWPAVVLLGGSMFALVLSQILAIDSASQSLVPVVLLCIVAMTLGTGTARVLLPSALMLYFALPAWWLLDYPLQWLTAMVANVVVGISGIPAHVEGNVFHLPIGQVEVASGCNGLNYLMVALALAYFQGMLYLRSVGARVRLIAVAALLALFSNWLRVCALIWIAYATDMQHYLIRVDHLYFGWGLFLLVVWPMFWYAARLEKREHAVGAESAVSGLNLASGRSDSRRVFVATGIAALLLVAPLLLQMSMASSALASSISPPWGPAGSVGSDHVLGSSRLIPAATEERARVQADGRDVYLYRAVAALYGGPELPGQAGELLGRRWQGRGSASMRESSAGLACLEQTGELDGRQYVMCSGLLVAGESVTNAVQAKLAILRGLAKGRTDEQLWLALAPCIGDCEGARTALGRILESAR